MGRNAKYTLPKTFPIMPEPFACVDDDCPNRGKRDYNCAYPSEEDGYIVQCVDRWAEDKFFYFDRYLEATTKARVKSLNTTTPSTLTSFRDQEFVG